MHTYFFIWESEKQHQFWKLNRFWVFASILQIPWLRFDLCFFNSSLCSPLPSLSECPCTMEECNVEAVPRILLVRQTTRRQKKQATKIVPVLPQLPTKSHYSFNILAAEDQGKNLRNAGTCGHSKAKTDQRQLLEAVPTSLSEHKLACTCTFHEWEAQSWPRQIKTLLTEMYRNTRNRAKKKKLEVNFKKKVS